MVISKEIFLWEVGTIGTADWKFDGATIRKGTLNAELLSCTGATSAIGFVSYGYKIYVVSKYKLDSISYKISGHPDNTVNKIYTENDLTEYRVTNGYVYMPSVSNGIVNVDGNEYSIPYIIANMTSALTLDDIFMWWNRRIQHGAIGSESVAEGYNTVAGWEGAQDYHVMDITYAGGQGAVAAGVRTAALEAGSVAVGLETESSGVGAVATGYMTKAAGIDSIATGSLTYAAGNYSLAHGSNSKALGNNSIAIGANAQAKKVDSIAIGAGSSSNGKNAVAIGGESVANGDYSFASGRQTNANGSYSQAGGLGSEALGHGNVAIGDHVKTNGKYQVGFGRWNDPGEVDADTDLPQYLFTIGDGNSEDTRHNAFSILNNGGFSFKGSDGKSHIFNENTISQMIADSENWWINKVEKINNNKYEIEVTNGIEFISSIWDVDDSDEDNIIWTSSSGQVIDMIGFDDTSEYKITEVDKINDRQYKMTAESKAGEKVVNIWELTEDQSSGKTTWLNTTDSTVIDFLNFKTDGETVTDLKDHSLNDYMSMQFIVTDSENKYGRLKLGYNKIDLVHRKR